MWFGDEKFPQMTGFGDSCRIQNDNFLQVDNASLSFSFLYKNLSVVSSATISTRIIVFHNLRIFLNKMMIFLIVSQQTLFLSG